jgi:hypothetical protein
MTSEDWLGYVRERRPGVLSKPRLMLAVVQGHHFDGIRNRLRNKIIDLVIIPSGMTQPLDVSVNKPFKHLACKHYDVWLNKDNHILTPSGETKRASVSITVEWKEVPVSITAKSFVNSGPSA